MVNLYCIRIGIFSIFWSHDRITCFTARSVSFRKSFWWMLNMKLPMCISSIPVLLHHCVRTQSLLVMYLTIFACYVFDFYVWDAVSIFHHLHMMFLPIDFAFRITDWTCCHGSHLHAILRIISRGVSGLATDSPCGVWGRGWTICFLHNSPLFGSHFKMRVGM